MKVLIIKFLLSAIVLFSSCGLIKPISVTSVGNFTTVNPLLRPEFRFDVGLKNPNSFGVTIDKMEIGLSTGGPVLAKISMLQGTQITKKETMMVPVALSPSINEISKLFSSGIDALLSGKNDNQFEVRGEIVIRKFIFRKRYQIKESIRL